MPPLRTRVRALTAHHLDDQAETVLHHILRGTHLTGLRGIAPISRQVIHRPWLELCRDEILDFLSARGQNHRTDPTNADTALTRNRLRHEVLPLLAQVNPRAVEHIAKLAGAAREALDLRAEKLSELDVQVFDAGELAPWLPLLGWPGQALEVYRLWGGWRESGQLGSYAASVAQLRLSTLSTAEHLALHEWAADPERPFPLRDTELSLPHRELLCLAQRGAAEPLESVGLSTDASVSVGGLKLRLAPATESAWTLAQRRDRHLWERIASFPDALAAMCASPPERPEWQCFLGAVELPLRLRTWRSGERIELAGGGSKTIGDVFTDAKVPESLRPLWAVLADAGDRAIWLPGLADGAPMRITGTPKWLVEMRQT